MTLNEALAVKARGLTKEQIIAHLPAVAENNLRADIRTIERAWKEKPSGLEVTALFHRIHEASDLGAGVPTARRIVLGGSSRFTPRHRSGAG